MADLAVVGRELRFRGKTYRCAVGSGGFSKNKKEGDGCTPLGIFPLRECWWRADRMEAPNTTLPLKIIRENDGWCDDPESAEYNRHVVIPSPAGGRDSLPPLAGGGRRGVSLHEENAGGMAQGVGQAAFTTRDSGSIKNAKSLRKNQTDAERRLWKALRQKQLENYKFRRQQPIGNYIVDFVSMGKKLIIELDGGQHNEDKQRRYDEKRTAYLESGGYRVLRFWNSDIFENIEGIVETIRCKLDPSLFKDSPVWCDTPHLTSPRKRGEEYSAPPQGGGGFERLFRDDHVYDVIVPLGYNDDPVVKGKGSAIFLHLAHDDYRPTEGCIALAKKDLLALLPALDTETLIEIKEKQEYV